MTQKFKNLVDKMSPEAQKRIQDKTNEMLVHLEKERRFLVQLPLSQEVQELLDSTESVEVTQTYLQNESGLVERVRQTSLRLWQQTFNHFFHTTKKHVAFGISEEDEKEISNAELQDLLKRVDLGRNSVFKTRYFLKHNQREFELDIFHGENEGLAILEIELDDLSEDIELPPFLNVTQEITGNSAYSNYNLAKKK